LVRFTLIWLDKQTSLFVSCMHHIISDGWSNSVLAHELSTLYHAYSHNLPSPLPQLPVQYADYAVWQRSWLQGEVLQQQLDYWHQQLAGAHPCNLPTDFPRPLSPGAQGDRQEFLLSATLTQELRTLSRQHGTTLFMTLLAALQVLLYRWSGEHDLVIGTDVANRNPVETEQLIGFFINLLALRTKVHGQASFSNLLAEVRETVLQAYLYQETPFEMLVEQLQLERRSAQTPLVQVLFVLQNLPPSQVTQAEELHLSPVEIGVSNVKFDLAIFAEEEGTELRWTMSYRRELFRAETIERLMQRFESLLHQITANPEIPVDLLDFLTPSEQKHLIIRSEDHRRKLKITKGKGIHVE
jgi:condensation domain-containing protein